MKRLPARCLRGLNRALGGSYERDEDRALQIRYHRRRVTALRSANAPTSAYRCVAPTLVSPSASRMRQTSEDCLYRYSALIAPHVVDATGSGVHVELSTIRGVGSNSPHEKSLG